MIETTVRLLKLATIIGSLCSILVVSSCNNQEIKNPDIKIQNFSPTIPLVAGFDFNQKMDSTYSQNKVFKKATFGGKQYDIKYTPTCYNSPEFQNCYLLKSVRAQYGKIDSSGKFIEEKVYFKDLLNEFSLKYDFQWKNSPVTMLWSELIEANETSIGIRMKYGVRASESEIAQTLNIIEFLRGYCFFVSKDGAVLYKFRPTSFEVPNDMGSGTVYAGEYFAYEDWTQETKSQISMLKAVDEKILNQNQNY